MRRILKWTVPVDDRPHNIGGGRVVRVDCQYGPQSVQVWTDELNEDGQARLVQVFSTGQPVPATFGEHLGSAMHSGLVWHVIEMRRNQ